VEPPEVPVLPEPVEPPEVPVLPEPLEPPELVEPLVVPDVPEVADMPAPLLPPHAVIANAMAATSNPFRTNDVFMM
jgi:hypothetical protein